jgi:hypothetical protein
LVLGCGEGNEELSRYTDEDWEELLGEGGTSDEDT